MLVKYIFNEKKAKPREVQLYAGDLFYDNLFFDLINILFLSLKEEYELSNFLKTHGMIIIIPSNLTFCADEEKIKKVQFWIEKMWEINVDLRFSYSTDGFYATDVREKNSLFSSQEWFDKTVGFVGKYNFGCHPMISAESIDNAIENYDWWIEMFEKHFKNYPNHWIPMFLEVRNDSWTQEKVLKYLDLLEHMIQDRIKRAGSIKEFTKHLYYSLYTKNDKPTLRPFEHNDIIGLRSYGRRGTMGCGLGDNITINCATMQVVPCHRLAYPHMAGAKFIKDEENKKIINIEAEKNINGYLNMVDINPMFKLKCSNCNIRDFCMTGCLGSQFEVNSDPFLPINSVCYLFKCKVSYLMDRYYNLGVFEYLFSNDFDQSSAYIKSLKQYLKESGYKI